MANGRAVVYDARGSYAFSAGIKHRHCIPHDHGSCVECDIIRSRVTPSDVTLQILGGGGGGLCRLAARLCSLTKYPWITFLWLNQTTKAPKSIGYSMSYAAHFPKSVIGGRQLIRALTT